MSRIARISHAFIVILSLGLILMSAAAAQSTPLSIVTGSGTHAFEVEVADNDTSRERGLMYRRSLAADHGMLFDFGGERLVSMWMKNTFISLDMIFIRADGRVHRIEAHTTPQSERIIDSGAEIRYVLEVPSGTAERIGLKRGDLVRHAMIGNR